MGVFREGPSPVQNLDSRIRDGYIDYTKNYTVGQKIKKSPDQKTREIK